MNLAPGFVWLQNSVLTWNGLERLDPVLVLGLLAGPPPAVGVDEVGAVDGLQRVVA